MEAQGQPLQIVPVRWIDLFIWFDFTKLFVFRTTFDAYICYFM